MSEALTREIDALRVLMGSPRDPHGRVFAQLGDALRRAGAHREALGVLLDGVAEHPNFSPGHLVLGWTAQETGDLTVARTAYERTVELDPENPHALFGLGTLLDAEGDPRGTTLLAEAESLDAGVREAAPGARPSMPKAGGAPAMGDPDLEHLPFLSLEELAPDRAGDDPSVPEDAALAGLPFVPLQELAPDAPESEGAGVDMDEFEEVEFDSLPFVSLEELRPEASVPDTADEGGGSPEEPDGPEDGLDLAGPLATRTMGELLLRQGLTAQAIEVFEVLVDRSPEDDGLRARLEELRGEVVGAGGEAAGEPEGADAAETPWTAEGDLEDLEDHHEAAAHPSMDPPVPHPEVPSPFHLADGDADDPFEDEGERVGDYFARLLAWAPARSETREDPGGGSEEGEPSS